MELETTHQQLTNMLLEAGCTISKPAIDNLVEWVRDRDISIVQRLQKEGDRLILQASYNYGLSPETEARDVRSESTTVGTNDLPKATPEKRKNI